MLSPGLILGGGASCFLRVEQPRVDDDYSARGDTTIKKKLKLCSVASYIFEKLYFKFFIFCAC